MFGAVCLLNINYAILRSARNALAVADLGGSAASIPLYELIGTMPGAVLMTYLLTKLLGRLSIYKVFILTLTTFTGFFLFFSFILYPALPSLLWIPHLPQLCSMTFFVMAELWKIALFSVLFWGLVNHYIHVDDAKSTYAPLMLASSVGVILAGPIVSACTSDLLSGRSWATSLNLMMTLLALISLATAWCFTLLWRHFADKKEPRLHEEPKESMTLRDGLRICLRSPLLSLLGWVTIANYLAYALGEVVFLDVLKQTHPDPRDYCDYMGKLSLWSGLLTAFSALVITPYLLRRYHWAVASLITPICLFVTEIAFFSSLAFNSSLVVLSGTALFCIVRASKYTLLDTSKELSFLTLPPLEKMQGKLIIDGICSRLGRSSASVLTLGLARLFGGVLASAGIAGSLALLISGSCVAASLRLGRLINPPLADPR